MMKGVQTRPATSKSHAEKSRGRFEPPDRIRKSDRALPNFSLGITTFSGKRAVAQPGTGMAPELSQSNRTPLAIDPYIAKIMNSFRKNRVVIVQAATGTGKSIGISEAIINEGYKLIATNPRRIGAVLLAEHLAYRDGSALGERFGYRHGRHREASPNCPGVFTTEGYQLKVMLNELKTDPTFRLGRGEKLAIMWDEAHERTAYGSVLLALCKEMMLAGRDIKLVISSATLDPKPIVDYFGKDNIQVPVHSIPVKHYPIIDVTRKRNSSLVDDIITSDRSLTFVYGKAAIASLSRDLALADPGLKVIPMHAELSQQEQQRALRQINQGEGRFAVVSTNNLQASVTLNIARVISTGLVRRERVGQDFERHLTIEDSSQAEEAQKRGRAGRLYLGEWSYHGKVAVQKLQREIPHEIMNCQLESLVLQTLSAGRDFSQLNRKLLFQAPDTHVARAMQSLYYLGLIGPKGHITELGRAVAELPTEVRTGKALALALKRSAEDGLSPEELILPMIDMVACVEARGIVTWESVCASYKGQTPDHNTRHGRWRKFLDRSHGSDPIAQMLIFRTISCLPVEQFVDWGIHLQHFNAAKNIREDICERLGIDPWPTSALPLSSEQVCTMKELYWAGSIDRLYRFVGKDADDPRKRVFKPVVGNGQRRMLSRDSVVEKGSFVIAEPITIDTKYHDEEPVRLLVMASAVDPKWLAKNTLPQLKNFVDDALEKVRQQKSKSEGKHKYRRPGGPRRHR